MTDPFLKRSISDQGTVESQAVCVMGLACIPYFSRLSIAGPILAGSHQPHCSRLLKRHADLIIDSDSQAFSRRLPWHPQAPTTHQILFNPLSLSKTLSLETTIPSKLSASAATPASK